MSRYMIDLGSPEANARMERFQDACDALHDLYAAKAISESEYNRAFHAAYVAYTHLVHVSGTGFTCRAIDTSDVAAEEREPGHKTSRESVLRTLDAHCMLSTEFDADFGIHAEYVTADVLSWMGY